MSARKVLAKLVPAAALVTALIAPALTRAPASVAGATVDHNFSGLVKIGGGRSIFVQCRGQGSPTVVLISGQGNDAHEWSQVLDPADPIHADPLDLVSAGQGDQHDSDQAVFPQVARTTRVCAYDRPDTRTKGADRSTPRAQPHTVDADVDDLRRVLRAVDAPKPYVLVAHSYGGFIAELYARTHPADVGGLVMVDAVSSSIEHATTASRLQAWNQLHRTTSPGLPEGIEVLDAIAQLRASPPPVQIPTVVLSADKPYPLPPPGPGDPDASVTFADWSAGQDLLATGVGAEHITKTNSGHHVYLYSPKLVVGAIRKVVGEVRTPPTTLTPVVQKVLAPPRWYRGDDGRYHVEYELQLTNTIPLGVDVTDIGVLDGHGRPVARLDGQRLTDAMTLLGSDTEPTAHLPASTVAIAWIDLMFTHRRQIPTALEHRVTIDVGPGLPIAPIVTATGRAARTVQSAPPTIGPPLRGGKWVAIVGPHRRALQAVNGALHLAQRYAIDFSARLDAGGRTHLGDADRSASYFNYGQPVVAVADATVVEAVDGLPDQIPNHKVPVSLAHADGNHVILRLRSGVFAGYAHLRPGSVRVEVGQHVRTGQVLGKLGNSGESGGPHLHFQLMNRPSIIDADGMPFLLDRYRLNGFTSSLDAFLDADLSGAPVPVDTRAQGPHRREGLTGLEVLTFARSIRARDRHTIS